MVSAGWAIELRGEKFDLDELEDSLRPPFDPWVEEHVEGGQRLLLLRSNGLIKLTSTEEIIDEATRLIDHINGVLLIGIPDAKPISLGIILRFREDGSRVPVLAVASAYMTVEVSRVRLRAVAGSTESPKKPAPSVMQLRLQAADQEPGISDLLTFVNRADNWFDIFKAMETMERLIGGEAVAQQISGQWKRVRQTANRHRHAPSPKYPLPASPPTLPEARAILIAVTRRVVDGRQTMVKK